jgi:hypothetical protein
MVSSQNGWKANDRSVITVIDIPGGRLAVHVGGVAVIFQHLANRYHNEVEALIWPGCWGYAERDVRGSTDISNHASGTAIDLNAPLHPLGTNPYSNYSQAQIDAIHNIVNFYEGIIRWGGDYVGRKDGMHFEINDGITEAQVDRIAAKCGGTPVPPAPPAPPAPAPPSDQVRQDQFNINDTGFPCVVDGVWGPESQQACKNFQYSAHLPADGICGSVTRSALTKVPSWHGPQDGDGGYPITQWQSKLKEHGWHIEVDGVWVPHSASIMRQYQAEKGLAITGNGNPQSWTSLYCTVN